MSTWAGIGPVIGAGSLDGFAVAVMGSGAFSLAITAPRRARRRQAVAVGAAGTLVAGPHQWLSRHVWGSRAAEVSGVPGVGETREAEPDDAGALELGALEAGTRVPGPSDAGALDPGAFEAGTGEPGALNAGAFEPRAFDPGAFEPRAFDPGAFEPGAFEAGAFAAGPFGAGAERLVRSDETGALDDVAWVLSVGWDGTVSGSRRSRHRLGEPIPGSSSPDRTPRGGASRGGAAPRRSGFPDSESPDYGFPDVAFPDESPPYGEGADENECDERAAWGAAAPDVAPPGWAPRDGGQAGWVPRDGEQPTAPWHGGQAGWAPRDGEQLAPLPDVRSREGGWRPDGLNEQNGLDQREAPFPEWAARERGRPGVDFPDVAYPDGTFGTSKRPEARRFPRHAAPAVGLGGRVGHWMTGLLAVRPLASGARG